MIPIWSSTVLKLETYQEDLRDFKNLSKGGL